MQYACANIHFTVQYTYLGEGRACFSFSFKTKNHSNQQSWTSNQRQANASTNQTLLSERKWEGWESLFLKEQHQAHLYANAL